MLKVKKFVDAKLPTVAHPGQDLGYDLYAAEDATLTYGLQVTIRTGIGIEFSDGRGAILRDRSSMAKKGLSIPGGVINAGYRGEIMVFMRYLGPYIYDTFEIRKGDKIAQMIPMKPDTLDEIVEAETLTSSSRGDNGFGSSGTR